MKNFGLENLTGKELLGQLLCLEISGCKDRDEIISIIKENKPGAIYVNNFESKEIKEITEIVNSVTKYPVLVVADVEHGPAGVFKDCDVELPNPMAWGACDDESLVERAGELTGKIARKLGVHLSLSPVVDINLNKNNPLVNIRCPSDSAKEVLKIGGAFARGMQKNGYLMATAKHFPGDGVDDRNQHFCTTVSGLRKGIMKAVKRKCIRYPIFRREHPKTLKRRIFWEDSVLFLSLRGYRRRARCGQVLRYGYDSRLEIRFNAA